MKQKFIVIIAGGRGERFWPASRLKKPKHLLPIVGNTSMLTQTIDRLDGFVPIESIFVITHREQREAVLKTCPQLLPERVVDEPMGRDTAAAIGLATVLVKQLDPEGVFAILPADHVIHSKTEFQSTLKTAFELALKESVLVTVGIKPTAPATEYGYIHRGPRSLVIRGQNIYSVQRFVEKPDRATAQQYIDAGDYYWNAGMFVWQVPTIEAALADCTPRLYQSLQVIAEGLKAGRDRATLLEQQYPTLEKISIDYAVMEKAKNRVTLEATFDWDDVGSWPAIANHYPTDASGNVVRGNAIVRDGQGSIIVNENAHLVALIGVDNLIVVHTKDATLICPKEKAQEIKALVRTLADDPKHQKWL